MEYFLLSILLLIIVGMYFYYEHKLARVRKQLLLTSSQFRNMKSEYKSIISKKDRLQIKFITPTLTTAITSTTGDIFLAPLSTATKVNSFNVKMEVSILDCAQINNEIWYYVSLPLDTTYNCRGWINRNNFSFTYSSSKNIVSIKKDI